MTEDPMIDKQSLKIVSKKLEDTNLVFPLVLVVLVEIL